MYTKDTIKEINPYDTYLNCLNILKELDLFNKWLVYSIDINYKNKKKFNLYTSSIKINFGPIWNIGDLAIMQWGKWLTYEQCMASMYMETFERLSAILYIILNVNDIEKSNDMSSEYDDQNLNTVIFYSKKLSLIMRDIFLNFYLIDNSLIKKRDNGTMVFDNLIDNTSISLPYQLYYYNWVDGLNAGNSKEEAILWWIYEVIERYCQKAFLEWKDDIEVKRIGLDSIKKEFPELKETILSLQNFNKIDKLRLIQIKLKWTSIYTYLFFMKSTWVFADFGAGTHMDKKIATIRAITELAQIQKFYDIDKLPINNIWWAKWNIHISDYFAQNIIEKKFMSIVEKVNINYVKININSIKDILDIAVGELKEIGVKTILLKDITIKKIDVITYIVRIPKFSLVWHIKYNSFFYTIPNTYINISTTIDGIEKLFIEINLNIDKEISLELINKYDELIYKLNDTNLVEYINKYDDSFPLHKTEQKDLLADFKLSYNQEDLNSFLVFQKKLLKKEKEEEDYSYIFEVYARIWFLDYWLIYLNNEEVCIEKNNKFKEIYDKYLNNLYEIYKNWSKNSDLKKKFVVISKYTPDIWSENR